MSDHECNGQGPCTGWVWCGWCGGQPDGCEFCDGTRKRGCPAVVGDIDGTRWEHGPASDGRMCANAGSNACDFDIPAGQPTFRRADDPEKLAHIDCVIPAHGAAPVARP